MKSELAKENNKNTRNKVNKNEIINNKARKTNPVDFNLR